MLTVIGDLLADVVVLAGAVYERGDDNPAQITHARGGSAANVAAAAARTVATRFIGRVGTDAAGEALASELTAAGVDVRVQRAGRTGSIVILVDDTAERTMLTDRGAAAELGPIDPTWLEGTRWLHLPLYGFVESGSRSALREAAEHARDAGIPISIDLSSVQAMRAIGSDVLVDLLEGMSPAVGCANADEAELFHAWDLAASLFDVFVVKRGANPVLVASGGGVTEVDVETVDDLVDTTGAGDAFAAGYLAAALSGSPPAACARAGAASASEALRRPGAL